MSSGESFIGNERMRMGTVVRERGGKGPEREGDAWRKDYGTKITNLDGPRIRDVWNLYAHRFLRTWMKWRWIRRKKSFRRWKRRHGALVSQTDGAMGNKLGETDAFILAASTWLGSSALLRRSIYVLKV